MEILLKVIAGADKGKTGKVIKTLKTEARVVVEGVHIVKKHSKPTSMNDKGGIFEIEAPIHVSNVKVIDEKEAKASKTTIPSVLHVMERKNICSTISTFNNISTNISW